VRPRVWGRRTVLSFFGRLKRKRIRSRHGPHGDRAAHVESLLRADILDVVVGDLSRYIAVVEAAAHPVAARIPAAARSAQHAGRNAPLHDVPLVVGAAVPARSRCAEPTEPLLVDGPEPRLRRRATRSVHGWPTTIALLFRTAVGQFVQINRSRRLRAPELRATTWSAGDQARIPCFRREL